MEGSAEWFLATLADEDATGDDVADRYVAALDHPDGDVRRHALDALSAALAALEAAYGDEHDAVGDTAAVALCQPSVASAVPSVERRAARDRLCTVLERGEAAPVLRNVLADFGADDPASLAPLRKAIRSMGDDGRFEAVSDRCRILRDVDAPWARETLASLAEYPHEKVREDARAALDHTE